MTVNTTSPLLLGNDYADDLTDLFRRVQLIEQQASGIAGTGSNVFPTGVIIGPPGNQVVLGLPISSVTGLTLTGSAYLASGYMDVSYTIPDSTVVEVEVFYALKAIGGGSYDIPRSVMVAGSSVRIQPLLCNRTYGVYVVPRNNVGIPGTPTPAPIGLVPQFQDVFIPADSTVPPALAGLVTNLGADTLVAAWTPVASTELDVLNGGYYEANLDNVDNTFAHVIQVWRGGASVMAFDGVHGTTNAVTQLAATTLPTIVGINNTLPGITSASAGNGAFVIGCNTTGTRVDVNDIVILSGFTPPAYNGTWVVQSVTSTTIVLSAAGMVIGTPVNATVIGTGRFGNKWYIDFAAAHGLVQGDVFDIWGFVPTAYNQAGISVYAVYTTTRLWVLNGNALPGAITTTGLSGYGIKNNAQTVINVQSAAGFPASSFSFYNNSEQMLVTAGMGTTTWTVTRAYNGSTAQTTSRIGSTVATGVQGTNYWLRVRAVSVGGVPGPWAVASGGGPIPAGGVAGTDIIARSIQAVSIVADSITAAEIAANTITAGEIAAGTITAAQLAALQLTVGQYVRSSNYVAGISGWNIDADGNAEFNNVMVRGQIAASTIQASTITGSTINGGSITAADFSTANSSGYPRLEIKPGGGSNAHIIGSSTPQFALINFFASAADLGNPAFIEGTTGPNGLCGLYLNAPAGSNYSTLAIDSFGFTVKCNQWAQLLSDTFIVLQGPAGIHLNNDATIYGNTLSTGWLAQQNNIFTINASGTNNWIWTGGDAHFNFTWADGLTNFVTLNAASFNVSSDATFKDTIVDLDNSHLIHQLRPVSFQWKDKTMDAGTHFGFLAQEVQKVIPQLVSEVMGPDTLHTPEERQAAKVAGKELPLVKEPAVSTGKLVMSYSELIPLLIAEVQKLRKEVNELQGAH